MVRHRQIGREKSMSQHPTRRCPVTQKIQHRTLAEAQKSAKYVRKHYGPKVEAYECWHCGAFHIGHGKSRSYKLKLKNKLKELDS